MKFLLAQNMVYMPTYGGANKYNRILLEELSALGHKCLAIAVASGVQGPVATTLPSDLISPHRDAFGPEIGVLSYCHKGVHVRSVVESRKLPSELRRQIEIFGPDWVLIGTEDSLFSLLGISVAVVPERVVYLARTTLLLPFGPDSALKDNVATERLSKVHKIYALTHFISDYIAKWGGLHSTVVPLAFYGKEPFPRLGSFRNKYVTMINPCQIKGIAIFLALARLFPRVSFAAVPTWGTTSEDRASLEALHNIHILQPSSDIDDVFSQTRILLVPSLWAETKGEVVIEAMLRGIPVMASNTGGLPEIKLGIEYVLPVSPIKTYQRKQDDRMLPMPVIPHQDITPWRLSMQRLLEDEAHYNSLSLASRAAANDFAKTANVDNFLKGLDIFT